MRLWNRTGIEWERIEDLLPEFRNLDECEQDPYWHGEGNVGIHTRSSVKALYHLRGWQELPEPDKTVVFLATLLHDLGKPECTTLRQGRIVAPGHAARGAYRARWILDRLTVPFHEREAIVRLIRYHSRPLFLMEKKDALREAVNLSQILRWDRLNLLAEADVLGRTSPDRNRMHERIEMSHEFCREYGILENPWPFSNAHTRFRYCHEEADVLNASLHDDCRCEVLLMSGLPASGKDTWITRKGPEWPVVSLDAFRKRMNISPSERQGPVVVHAREAAREYLRKGQSFIWNATNTTKSMRRSLIRLFRDYNARIRIIYVHAPLALILTRNAKRSRPVPEKVIQRLTDRLDVLDVTEAHHVEYGGT